MRRDRHSPTRPSPASPKRKVFGIGLGKTGTSSLHRALELLGYKSLHSGDAETMGLVSRAIDEGRPLLHYLDPEPDAVLDSLAIRVYFYLADVQYPGSKFILTTRDLDDWLDSRRRDIERSQQGDPGSDQDGVLKVDVDAWTAEYVEHESVVRAYFADRPDYLLVFDLIGGDGWEPLCEFLGRPVPEAPFPGEKRSQPSMAPRGTPPPDIRR
jgi:Sulfotransferase domain